MGLHEFLTMTILRRRGQLPFNKNDLGNPELSHGSHNRLMGQGSAYPAGEEAKFNSIAIGERFMQAGDKVVYSKFAGTEVSLEGKEHVILKARHLADSSSYQCSAPPCKHAFVTPH